MPCKYAEEATMTYDPVRIAIVGCGNISGGYARSLATRPGKIRLVGAYDVDPERVQAFCASHGGRAYTDLDALLADEELELVVNLTSHHAHTAVSLAALNAGKHLHSEKPLAATLEDGQRIVALASERGVRLSCSPFTFLGEGQQALLRELSAGRIGRVLAAYAEMNWGMLERWHPNPAGFYDVGAGPMLDVGVYALTLLTALLGPVVSVTGFGRVLLPNRTIGSGPLAGQTFVVRTPDLIVGGLEFASGALGRVTASFIPGASRQAPGTELHGELGTLRIDHNHNFDGNVELFENQTREWTAIAPNGVPYQGVEWGRGLFDLADALRLGTPQRVTGTQALHVLEICLGILHSAEEGRPVAISSTFEVPPPMDE
jgi:predicted dehydrogenase